MVDQVPSIAALARELQDLKAGMSGTGMRFARVPALHGADHIQQQLVEALRAEIGEADLVIFLMQFESPLFLDGDYFYDATDLEVCHVDELIPRYVERMLWHHDCPYPVDLGLVDDRPTPEEIEQHDASVTAALLKRSFTPDSIATEEVEPTP